jgi:hypothetical protein
LRIYEKFGVKQYRDFDLCAVSAFIDRRFDSAVYYGKVEGITFTVKISCPVKEDVKVAEISLESREKIRLALIFAVKPALGERTAPERFYRFHKDTLGFRVLRLSDGGVKPGMLAVFSPDMTASYTETAAFRSDGAVFRGESDAVILLSRMELCGKKTVRFYLAAAFSEAHYRSLLSKCKENPIVQANDEMQCIYQTLYTRIYERSGFYRVSDAYDVRALLSDALSMLPLSPIMTKSILLHVAAHQYEEGDIQQFWHPTGAGLRNRSFENSHLLINALNEYILKTGDHAILNAKIPYLSSPVLAERERTRYEFPEKTDYRETLSEHMKRAMAYAERTFPRD